MVVRRGNTLVEVTIALLIARRLLDLLGPDAFELILVGDDKRCGEAKSLQGLIRTLGIAPVVRIDTHGEPAVMRRYCEAADVLVSLVDNIQETFGLTVTQAIAGGLPVVVSDWDGCKDTVVHGETGFRVRTHWAHCDEDICDFAFHQHWMNSHLYLAQSVVVDMDEAAGYLRTLVVSPDLRRCLGQAGRRRAEHLYAWPVVIRRYRDLRDECRQKLDTLDVQRWLHPQRQSRLAPPGFRGSRTIPRISSAPGPPWHAAIRRAIRCPRRTPPAPWACHARCTRCSRSPSRSG